MGASTLIATPASLTPVRFTDLTNVARVIKATRGRVTWYHIYNPNSVVIYVHFYDLAAASVVVGTTVPVVSLAIPSITGAPVTLDGSVLYGIPFATAISVAATTTPTGGTAPATALLFNCVPA